MWFLWIAYFLGALFLVIDDYETWKKDGSEYASFKKHWQEDHCSKGEHFVGINPPYPHCDVCGKVPRSIMYDKAGRVIGWKW